MYLKQRFMCINIQPLVSTMTCISLPEPWGEYHMHEIDPLSSHPRPLSGDRDAGVGEYWVFMLFTLDYLKQIMRFLLRILSFRSDYWIWSKKWMRSIVSLWWQCALPTLGMLETFLRKSSPRVWATLTKPFIGCMYSSLHSNNFVCASSK